MILFHVAVEKDETEVVVEESNRWCVNLLLGGISPLFRACKGGQVPMAQTLLEIGANPNLKNDLAGITDFGPMQGGIESGKVELVELLRKAGVPFDSPGPLSRYPLYAALEAGHEPLALKLIEWGADITKRDNQGIPLIFPAAAGGNFRVVKYLITMGANLYEDLGDGYTVLHQVAVENQPAMLKFLLEIGAKTLINRRWIDNNWTPISQAVEHARLANVKILVKEGADLSLQYKGLTLLGHAKKEAMMSAAVAKNNPVDDWPRMRDEHRAIVEYLTPFFP